ncbi:uncharacterized protein GLRG_09995 [Colletotrichum graminicola M1.001]|uniref:HNH nuclease domain-containing protein n=1 Tax=Colletotrichum graminicola (strain M1.001 / M2 / FGSC 10212) TaxID=645133 RepID=E3QVG3_COLGM|nr:uncharacterized protein GLRG_09995 [Colletotrichum graminicola M1.001]EFQ34851.1 hypothetical protein GLRG_09995 [Colletotrichum graminicola M1.001]
MALIPQVQAALRDQGYEHVALAPMWAALWTIPISQVASLLEDLRDPSVAMLLEGQLTMINNNFLKFLKIYNDSNRHRYQRSITERDQAAEQDGQQCVVTKAPDPHKCHIFPFSALNHQDYTGGSFLVSMARFWGEDRIRTLSRKLGGRYAPGATNNMNIVDTCANMISLSPQLHDCWLRGYFAFEPMGEARRFDGQYNTGASTPTVSESTRATPPRAAKKLKPLPEEYSIQLRFHWLKDTTIPTLKSLVDFSVDPITIFKQPVPNQPDPKCYLAAVDLSNWRPVENGQIITIKAQERGLLPDYDILLLQWDVLRMWRLAGGADPEIYSFDSDDDTDEDLAVTVGKTTEDSQMQMVDQPHDTFRRRNQGSSETAVTSNQDLYNPRGNYKGDDPDATPPTDQGDLA